MAIPTAEKSNDLLLRDQIDLMNLLAVRCPYDHLTERHQKVRHVPIITRLKVCLSVSPSLVTSTTNSPSSVPKAILSRSAETKNVESSERTFCERVVLMGQQCFPGLPTQDSSAPKLAHGARTGRQTTTPLVVLESVSSSTEYTSTSPFVVVLAHQGQQQTAQS